MARRLRTAVSMTPTVEANPQPSKSPPTRGTSHATASILTRELCQRKDKSAATVKNKGEHPKKPGNKDEKQDHEKPT
jgi:hypothetical protein